MKHVCFITKEGTSLSPFLGHSVDSAEELTEFLQEECFNPNYGYPQLYIPGKVDYKIVFVGSYGYFPAAPLNPRNSQPYKWAVYRGSCVVKFVDIRCWDSYSKYLEDQDSFLFTMRNLNLI